MVHNEKTLSLIIPAAGLGSRLFPASWGTPKELFPLGSKPVIHYALEEAQRANINKIVIITSPYKESLWRYVNYTHEQSEVPLRIEEKERLNSLDKLNKNFVYTFVTQQKALGVGNALVESYLLIKQDSFFAMVYPDDIIINSEYDLSRIVEIHRQYNCSVIALQKVDPDKVHLYGMVAGEKINDSLFAIHNIIEKPSKDITPSYYAIVGRYVLSTAIFQYITNDNKYCFATALSSFVQNGNKVLGVIIDSHARLDIGTVEGWYNAIEVIRKTHHNN